MEIRRENETIKQQELRYAANYRDASFIINLCTNLQPEDVSEAFYMQVIDILQQRMDNKGDINAGDFALIKGALKVALDKANKESARRAENARKANNAKEDISSWFERQ